MPATTVHKGKKQVIWYNDPEILYRLSSVGALMHQGARIVDIAQSLDVSIDTARRDIKRVREWWRREAVKDLSDLRIQAIDHYRYMITEAWQKYTNATTDVDRRGWIRVVMDCQKQIDDITGTNIPQEAEPEGRYILEWANIDIG